MRAPLEGGKEGGGALCGPAWGLDTDMGPWL